MSYEEVLARRRHGNASSVRDKRGGDEHRLVENRLITSSFCECVVFTDEDGAEEEGDGDVNDGGGHVQEPVGRHREEPQEEQEEEQAVLILLHLRENHRINNNNNTTKT